MINNNSSILYITIVLISVSQLITGKKPSELRFSNIINSTIHNNSSWANLSKSSLVSYYTELILATNTQNPLEKHFMRALAERANDLSNEIPKNLYTSIITYLKEENTIENNSIVPISIEQLDSYGCWCNKEIATQYHTNGVGGSIAVDEYDTICKKMHMCQKCTENDGCTSSASTANNTTIMPSSIDISLELIDNCRLANNGNECAANLCSCRVQIVEELLNLIWQQESFLDNGYISGNGFIEKDTCLMDNSLDMNNFECCGHYPKRYPFSKPNLCCQEDQQIYNYIFQSCCPIAGVTNSFSC